MLNLYSQDWTKEEKEHKNPIFFWRPHNIDLCLRGPYLLESLVSGSLSLMQIRKYKNSRWKSLEFFSNGGPKHKLVFTFYIRTHKRNSPSWSPFPQIKLMFFKLKLQFIRCKDNYLLVAFNLNHKRSFSFSFSKSADLGKKQWTSYEQQKKRLQTRIPNESTQNQASEFQCLKDKQNRNEIYETWRCREASRAEPAISCGAISVTGIHICVPE